MTEPALSATPAFTASSSFPDLLCGDYQLHLLDFPTYYVEEPSRRKSPFDAKGEPAPGPDAGTLLPTPRARQVFGTNLRHARRMKFLSQRQFALIAGVSRSYIGEVERGHHNICINRMEALAIVMGLPLRDMLDENYYTAAGYRRRN